MKIKNVSGKELDQEHLHILNNTNEVILYISQHIYEIKVALDE